MNNLEVAYNTDTYLAEPTPADFEYHSKSPIHMLFSIDIGDLEKVADWFLDNQDELTFDEDGDCVGIKGVPYPVFNLLTAMFKISKREKRMWVKIALDVWGVDEEVVKDKVSEAISELDLPRGTEVIEVEDYD